MKKKNTANATIDMIPPDLLDALAALPAEDGDRIVAMLGRMVDIAEHRRQRPPRKRLVAAPINPRFTVERTF